MTAFLAGDDLTAAALNAIFASFLTGAGGVATPVLTSETSSSTSYTNLATVGPSVTLNSSGTLAWCMWSAQEYNATAANGAAVAVEISGATTTAASDDAALGTNVGSTGFGFMAAQFAVLAITPGSNTYTLKYRVAVATTGTWARRRLFVFAP